MKDKLAIFAAAAVFIFNHARSVAQDTTPMQKEIFPPSGYRLIKAKSWSFIGPFFPDDPIGRASPLKNQYPPDLARDFCVRYPDGRGAMLFWDALPQPPADAKLNLPIPKEKKPENPGIIYFVTYIEAPKKTEASVAFFSDEPFEARLNGASIGEFEPRETKTSALALKQGLNEILVKVLAEKPGTSLSAAIDENSYGSLVFSRFVPWPLAPAPPSVWKTASAVSDDTASIKKAILVKDKIGLPDISEDGKTIVWSDTEKIGEDAMLISRLRRSKSTTFMVCHIFFPLRFHGQPYKFKLFCPKGSAFYINSLNFNGSWDEKTGALSGSFFAHQLRSGPNRAVIEIPPGNDDAKIKLLMSNPGDVKFMPELPPAMDPNYFAKDWPSTVISNGIVTAEIAVPDSEKGFYRGNRFEQAGIITRLEYGGHRFFMDAVKPHDPTDSGVCCGPCEEWLEAVGYDDAKVGEPFIKLGVGLYEKPFYPVYKWYCAYWPLQSFSWAAKIAKNRAEFRQ